MPPFSSPPEQHTTREPPSATRPPQLNSTICGCQSGSGCHHEMGGGEGGDDDGNGASISSLSTLVGSHDSATEGEEFPPSPDSPDSPEQRHELERFEPCGFSSWEQASFEEIRARFPGAPGRVDRRRRTQLMFGSGDDDAADSLSNEPFESGEHSVVMSDRGSVSVRGMSPGPGLGAWTEGLNMEMEMEMGMEKYYFIVSPLRLTPQRVDGFAFGCGRWG